MATIDLGKIKQVFRGTYDNSTAYVPDDLVVFTDGSVTSTYICTTATNGGVDNITGAQYDAFEQVFFASSGITFSINTSGNLIATI